MTQINRIVLQGFKSFNKKISIPLLAGFNVICGPNGVGKSNVLDAIIFVLGRTSAKSLRADRLHELIFHGSNGKNPAEYASVTIYLDNMKKTFPYNEEEVSVSRKVNRRGVSIYKINGKTTTREKVLELFSAARIYPDGHNIVLQGDITQIIEMNPVERRTIIDEISGIAEYDEKKEKAMKDLAAVDSKLKEAEIVITERFDIYKRLEEESKAALRYRELQQKLLVLKASLANKKLVEYEKFIKNFDEEVAKKEKENEELQKEIDKIERDLEERERGIRELAGRLLDISKKVEEEREISFLRTKIMINKDKIDSNKREIERIESLILRLESIEKRGEPRVVQEILRQKFPGVHGTVSNIIKVSSKYQIAMDVAAGPHINDIIVDSDETAKNIIDFLKREKIGRATFIPLNKIKSREFEIDKKLLDQEGVIGIASKLIDYDKKFSAAIEFVFGNTLVVKDLDIARKIGIGKARMVTPEGDLTERTGVMIGGFLKPRERMKDDVSEYLETRKRLEEEIERFGREVEQMENKLKSYGVSEETKQLIDMQKLKIDTEEELEKMRNSRKIAYEKRLAVQTELNKLKIQKAKYEADLENVKIEIKQYGEIKEFLDQAIRTLEQKIRQAEIELGSLGPVNFKAIEQFEKFKTEFDEYKKRYEKILEEKKAVLDMIQQIESKRKEVFFKTMNELSVKFNEIFGKMTGGNASLNLENPEDLESGLLIQASPAGKLLLNIDSMSGGEKTLTALAFLFSVQEYRPAPFYILDEVDAALDKENSKKVADLIKTLSKAAQFIVITHNDTTIKFGDRVYGVTMEAGESKILGLELPK